MNFAFPEQVGVAGGLTVFGMILSFQFFSMEMLVERTFHDLKTDMKFRLYMAPVKRMDYMIAASLVGFLFTMVQGLLIWGISAIFFDFPIGNIGINLLVMVVIAILSQLIGLIICLLVPKYQAARTIVYIFCFGSMALSNALFIEFGSGAVITFIQTYFVPLYAGVEVIAFGGMVENNSEMLINRLLVLVAWLLVLSLVVVILSRRKKHDYL